MSAGQHSTIALRGQEGTRGAAGAVIEHARRPREQTRIDAPGRAALSSAFLATTTDPRPAGGDRSPGANRLPRDARDDSRCGCLTILSERSRQDVWGASTTDVDHNPAGWPHPSGIAAGLADGLVRTRRGGPRFSGLSSALVVQPLNVGSIKRRQDADGVLLVKRHLFGFRKKPQGRKE